MKVAVMANEVDVTNPAGPSGGWGSLLGISQVMFRERPSPAALETLIHQNKAGGHMCTSCAWGKPAKPLMLEFCENGAKATLWELTTARCTPDFFASHTVTELLEWSDYDLEMQGRLTHPLRYDAATDKYLVTTWEEAFRQIGAQLKKLDPKTAIFYASGRASLETTYLYALYARMYGHNNLPDSSNMCHETTSVALKESIGSPVGTCILEDFETCDAIFYFGQNPGTNSPRMLHPLQSAVRRGCKIITFNPVLEKGLIEFVDPQSPTQMVTNSPTRLSHMYLQVLPGGDIAALMGLAKHVFEVDDAHIAAGQPSVMDVEFIAQHCSGFDEFRAEARSTPWPEIEKNSGLSKSDLCAAADVYIEAKNTIAVYGMGLTQHVHGSKNVSMLVNFMLLKGNIGRPGTGMCPVRGHSNVQGQRTVGMSEKPELVPLNRFANIFGFEPPQGKGRTTVEVCDGILDGSVKAFIGLGGNFVRAIPEGDRLEPSWRDMDLTVEIATKLNRSHLITGKSAWLLPCLARSEEDIQASGPQTVSMEDSFSHIHGSVGKRLPASEHLKSELAIVAEMAKATLPSHPKWRWDAWTADYALVRDLIEETYPEQFKDMNTRMMHSGGFYRGNSARSRVWKTESGKAQFMLPKTLSALGVGAAPGRFHLITMRSNDQFNTTIYGHDDRHRGLSGSRMIVLINPSDMRSQNLKAGDSVSLVTDTDDGVTRKVSGLTVTPYALPSGSVGGYYPEMNPLVPLWYHDEESKTPAFKSVPVRIEIDPA
jgi:molybdopterin-dependent oxidoreductase alpha subunit